MLTLASALFNTQGQERKMGRILLNNNLFDSVASAKDEISPACSQHIIPFDNYADMPFIFYGMLIVFTSGHGGLFGGLSAGSRQSYARLFPWRLRPVTAHTGQLVVLILMTNPQKEKPTVRSAFTARMLVIELHYQTQVQGRKPKDV